jgi:integrase
MEPVRRKRTEIERKPYANEEIQDIVDRLELPKIEVGQVSWMKPGNYWIPLIAMFSGMRKSEICQLYKSDVIEQDGVQCIRVTDGKEGQSLKFRSSHRIVPIHSQLVAIGFLQYVEECQSDRLFPELKIRMGMYSQSWKWFDRAVRREVSKEPGKSFHSLRHGVAIQLGNADITTHLRYPLLGHALPESDEGSMRTPISALSDAVEKIVYPGINFDRLMVAKG